MFSDICIDTRAIVYVNKNILFMMKDGYIYLSDFVLNKCSWEVVTFPWCWPRFDSQSRPIVCPGLCAVVVSSVRSLYTCDDIPHSKLSFIQLLLIETFHLKNILIYHYLNKSVINIQYFSIFYFVLFTNYLDIFHLRIKFKKKNFFCHFIYWHFIFILKYFLYFR